jgi:hypothetical protein
MSRDLMIYFADILANPKHGMTWSQIATFFRRKGSELKVAVPYPSTIFPFRLPSRKVGFIENLSAFSREDQGILLRELCRKYSKINTALLQPLLTSYINECARRRVNRDNQQKTSGGLEIVG